MHNSNSKKILSDTATTNLLEISPVNQAVLNYNLSSAIKADRPSYQNHFINHSFYPPLVTTSYNQRKHAEDVNHYLNEFFDQTTTTHKSLAEKNPFQAQTYLQNRLGFLGKVIDPMDPNSALNQSGLQNVSVVDKFGQTHANFGSAQINNLKTLSDMWQMNNDLLSRGSHDPHRYYQGSHGVTSLPDPASRGSNPASPAGSDPASRVVPAPASRVVPALASPRQAPASPISISNSPPPASPRPDSPSQESAPASPRPAPAPYESSGSDLSSSVLPIKTTSTSNSPNKSQDGLTQNFKTSRPLKGNLISIVADLKGDNTSPQQSIPTPDGSLSPSRRNAGKGL